MGDQLPPPSPGSSSGPEPSLPTPGAASTPLPPPPPAELTHPPGYVAYATAPTPSAQVTRIGGLTTWMTWLIAAAGLTGVISAILVYPVIDQAADLLRDDITLDEFEDAYTQVQLIQGLQSVVGVAAGVVTVIWMFRIASNLRAHSKNTTFHPVLGIFSWLLPPFLYVLPMLILREMWKASDPDVVHGTEDWKSSRVDPLLWVWFVVYGVAPAVLTVVVTIDTVQTLFSNGLAGSTDLRLVAESLESTGNFTLASGALAGVAAIVWIVFARRLASRHMALTGEQRG